MTCVVTNRPAQLCLRNRAGFRPVHSSLILRVARFDWLLFCVVIGLIGASLTNQALYEFQTVPNLGSNNDRSLYKYVVSFFSQFYELGVTILTQSKAQTFVSLSWLKISSLLAPLATCMPLFAALSCLSLTKVQWWLASGRPLVPSRWFHQIGKNICRSSLWRTSPTPIKSWGWRHWGRSPQWVVREGGYH